MRTKKIAVVAVIVAAATIALLVSATKTWSTQNDQPVAVARQLPAVNGMIPVEIRNVRANFFKRGEVGDFSCIARNNTDKPITTVVLHYTIVTGSSTGKELGDTTVLYRESFVHPDVREAHQYRPLAPGEEYIFESNTKSWFETGVKRVEANIDYVEFEDKTKLGPDVEGSRIIGQLRLGAASYKDWLVQRFRQPGSSVQAILPFLQARDLPSDLALDSVYLKEGAKVYRNHMLRVFTAHGSAELEKYLKR